MRRETMNKLVLFIMICLLTVTAGYAADKTVSMQVGETQTLRLPSYITSKAIKGSQWTSTHPNEIAVMSQTPYSATVKVLKAVPSTTTCLIHCQYYYYEAVGNFTYLRTGIYDFKVETEQVLPTRISLPASITIDVGESKYLTPTISPSDAQTELTWSSSLFGIINVFQNGRVYAEGEGSAIITVRTSNGLSASCAVTAKKSQINVTSIQITPASHNLTVGEKYKLTASVLPTNATDKTLTWKSSMPNIVSVDQNGAIEALRTGSAVITASSSNGKTATCLVTCKENIKELAIMDNEGLTDIPPIANIQYERIFYAGWNSVCLPFAFDIKLLGLQNAKIAEICEIETIGDQKSISYREIDRIEAGKPCLIYVPTNQKCKLNLQNVTLVSKPITNELLIGTFSETIIGSGCYKLTPDGNSFAITKTNSAVCKPFRAYIK